MCGERIGGKVVEGLEFLEFSPFEFTGCVDGYDRVINKSAAVTSWLQMSGRICQCAMPSALHSLRLEVGSPTVPKCPSL